MEELAIQPCDGLIILIMRVRDPDRREQVVDRLTDIGADRVAQNAFELSTADWDAGLWDDEVEWFSDLLELTRDSLIVWRFTANSFVRFTIGEGG
ncbi:MAG: hypothetical protein JWP89_2457 [Schlesneria sp.]|nr:hypothetical protein [Schlesneria sp.]